MTLSDDLNATADEIERCGWTQQTYWDRDTGQVCLVGGAEHMLGMYHADGQFETDLDQSNLLGKIANAVAEYLEIGGDITKWNDEDDRTQDGVI